MENSVPLKPKPSFNSTNTEIPLYAKTLQSTLCDLIKKEGGKERRREGRGRRKGGRIGKKGKKRREEGGKEGGREGREGGRKVGRGTY